MSPQLCNQVITLWHNKTPQRRIAKLLGISRGAVKRAIQAHMQARTQGGAAPPVKPKRPSMIEPFQDRILLLLERYPDITGVRLHQELTSQGFQGGYSTVRDYLQQFRLQPVEEPPRRFETAPGRQGQMDYATYTIDFTAEGRRRVEAFSYLLGFSRRQYLEFFESQNFATTCRGHVNAFEYLDGVAAECLYDNFKVIVTGYDGGQPVYNTRFLAFATFYGFRPVACRPRRPQTKGKVERAFHFVETNLLNGRSFSSLEHLNQTARWWLANVADTRRHPTTGKTPLELYQQERPLLLPLPAKPFDTAEVLYLCVQNRDSQGFVFHEHNYYSVPWRYTGHLLPVRVTTDELIVYAPDICEIARHRLLTGHVRGVEQCDARHRPPASQRQREELLRARFAGLGPGGANFFDQLLRVQRYGKDEAQRILALLGVYHTADLTAALERAARYRAFSAAAIERILAASATPRTPLESLSEAARQHLDELLRQNPVAPRSTGDYQSLLFPDNLTASNGDGEDPGDGGEESSS